VEAGGSVDEVCSRDPVIRSVGRCSARQATRSSRLESHAARGHHILTLHWRAAWGRTGGRYTGSNDWLPSRTVVSRFDSARRDTATGGA
jgi:hypothetical protein